jgi:formiminotetrahydrofolate cyclodeaminase
VDSPGYIDESLRSFLVKLAGRSPEPAGGAALALAAASAAALVSLTCHAGMLRAAEPDGDDPLVACQRAGETMAARLQHLIDADVKAYREVSRCLRLPNGTHSEREMREAALDSALVGAIEVPLEVAETGLEILALAVQTAPATDSPALGDLAAAMHLAEAAVKGSLRNARINAAGLADREYAAAALSRVEAYQTRLVELAEAASVLEGRLPT